MSKMEANPLDDAGTSRVESGEKSTPLMSATLSQGEKTPLYVLAFHTNTSPIHVPAAIHLPSLDTARHRTRSASSVAICLPSSTRHTRTPPSPPLKRYSPFAENVAAYTPLSTLISIAGRNSQHQTALHLVSTHSSFVAVSQRHNLAAQW